jgi:hypothetical protein
LVFGKLKDADQLRGKVTRINKTESDKKMKKKKWKKKKKNEIKY